MSRFTGLGFAMNASNTKRRSQRLCVKDVVPKGEDRTIEFDKFFFS
jgi:hypothetical protein